MISFLKDVFRRVLYYVLRISHLQGEKRNIIFFSTRRGGSTFFSQLITISDFNLRYYDHLFSWYQTDFVSRKFFNPEKNNQEIYLTDENKNYFELVNAGKHISRTVCNPFSQDFVRKSNRILYKITEGKGLFDWFITRNDLEVIYQLRHPIPTALSTMRLGWDLTLDSYLNNKQFIDEYLEEDKYNYCMAIKNGTDLLSKYVLNWVLENLIPLKSKYLNKTFIISYEELLINPKIHLDELCKRLDLDNHMKMYDLVNKPSRSSSFSSKETIQNMRELDVYGLIGSWKDDIDDETEKRLMNILRKFEIDIYSFGELSINKKYINYGTN